MFWQADQSAKVVIVPSTKSLLHRSISASIRALIASLSWAKAIDVVSQAALASAKVCRMSPSRSQHSAALLPWARLGPPFYDGYVTNSLQREKANCDSSSVDWFSAASSS